MRIQLAAAVALAPLMMASGAAAQTVISNERTTPISTSTSNNGAPGSITVNNTGILNLDNGSAIAIDSNHDVTIQTGGQILMDSAANGAVGILANGGVTADIVNDGTITVTENYTATDSDNDGDLDGPLASGTGRYGIRITGPGVFTGDINSNGTITIEGNHSAGISVESDIVGNVINTRSVVITGDQSFGIRTTGTVDGDIYAGGNITAQGEGATAVSIEGDVTGRVTVGGTLASTGFRSTAETLTTAQVDAMDADDLLVGGPALNIAANIAGGVVLDFQPEAVTGVADSDGDGIIDTREGTATISSFGSAPAVQVGSASQTVTLGQVGAGDEAFGFINRGAVLANGRFEGFSATAIQIGGAGNMAVVIDGGLRNNGSATAVGIEADVRALMIDSGATVADIYNQGLLRAVGNGDSVFDVVAVDIAAGASVNNFTNRGRVTAVVAGEAADSIGIRDSSGGLTTFNNFGIIEASIVPTDSADDTDDDNLNAGDEVITGQAIAVDLRANTSGVVFIQDGIIDGDDGNDGVADIDSDGDGVDDLDEPSITGNILLGAGADQVEIRNGVVNGDLSFGDGADTFLVDGGAVVRGAITDSDGLLSIDVADGLLDARQATVTTITGLHLGSDSALIVTLDGATGTVGGFQVNGTATIDDGAGLGARLTSLLNSPPDLNGGAAATRFVIVDATNLTVDVSALDVTSLEQNSPYMYRVTADANANQLFLDVRHRTAAEFGFIAPESATYTAFYEALATDTELMNAFLAQTTRDGFFGMYEQVMPEHSGGSLMSLATGVDAVTRALAGRGHAARDGETSAWVQEINFYADKDRVDGYGFRSEGFGFAGGVERGTGLGALGLSFALTSSDLQDPESEAEEVLSAQLLELGLYWRAQGANWNIWARGAAGYASFTSVRQLIATGINRRNDADWNGYSLALAAGAAYNYQTGRWSIRPEASVEYFRLMENGYQETGAGGAFDLAYEDREGHILSSTVAVSFGASFGENNWLRPELRVGWRQIISHDPGVTVASFISTGTPFSLTGDSLEGGGPIVGLRLNLGNELGFLSIDADAEMLENYVRYALLLRASFRF